MSESKIKIGFIGCGNMGKSLATAICKTSNPIYICDRHPERLSGLISESGAVFCDALTVARECKYIFIAVKPNGMQSAVDNISPILKERGDGYTVVSLAAGIDLFTLERFFGFDCPIIRIMPNTPVAVGEGVTVYCENSMVNKETLSEFENIMRYSGKVDRISEEKIDAAMALSGCSPAFVYTFAEALADGAVECGLPRDKARLYAALTLLGSAKMLLESGCHSAELKDAVCSPGGVTIKGIHALEEGAFRGTVMNAVKKAFGE